MLKWPHANKCAVSIDGLAYDPVGIVLNNANDHKTCSAVQSVVMFVEHSPAKRTAPMAVLTAGTLHLGYYPDHRHGQT